MSNTDGAGMAERLVELCAEMGADELRVLLLVAERLTKGRAYYGALHVDSDRRDFGLEALEEAADGLVYVACGLLRSQQVEGAR